MRVVRALCSCHCTHQCSRSRVRSCCILFVSGLQVKEEDEVAVLEELVRKRLASTKLS